MTTHSPDLPGCVSTGETQHACESNMPEAVAFHLDGLKEDGEAVPKPKTVATYLEVA